MSYPPINILNRADRFLFDTGYSRGLLMRANNLLAQLAQPEVANLSLAIDEFLVAQAKLYRDELYTAGEEAALKETK